MGRFAWALPVAGLAISVGGLMGGALSGQPSESGIPDEPPAVELLSPEFETSAEIVFETPPLEWEPPTETPLATEPAESDLPVVEPLPTVPPPTATRHASWPVVVPGPTFFAGNFPLPSELTPPKRPEPEAPPAQLSEPEWMNCPPEPIFEAAADPIPSAPGPQDTSGLPPLPNPILPAPGHSRARTSEIRRPGHSAPKRLSESAAGIRAW